MKRSILIVAAFAVALVSCDQSENALPAMTDTQFVEFKTDGTSFFNVNALETNFTTSVEDLSQADINGLIKMREEEKMAQEVYLKFQELWGNNVFANIAKSEASHANAVLSLLDYFGISDPTSIEVGVFTNASIQSLYNELVSAGTESVLKAFETAAFNEEYDIQDLENLLAANSNTDIQIVYGNLLKGSRNHLRAFVKQINVYGSTYSPFLLSDEYYQDIVESSMENGNGNARWGNAGNGRNGQGGISYNDCLGTGVGGLNNGLGTGTGVCDNTGVTNVGNQNSGSKGPSGKGRRG